MSDSLDYRSFLEAASFAARAHREQFRKDGVTPYVSHVFRVCLVVRHVFGFDDTRMLMAALLHDTIEDTTTDFDDITERFGPEIATWVAFLSKDKRLPDDDRERAYLERLRTAPWQVQVCKLADMYDNLTDMCGIPQERRGRSVHRIEHYMEALQSLKEPQVQEPIRLVQELLRKTRGEFQEHRGRGGLD
jgi:guanosine-3',5'-bis(diphosphate) 3'-pyrophosphohydrolase